MDKNLSYRELWVLLRKQLTGENLDEFFGDEYDKLVAYPGVRDVIVYEEGFSIRASVFHPISGTGRVYYLGTYLLTVDVNALLMEKRNAEWYTVKVVDPGRLNKKLDPMYPLTSSGFCFGDRRDTLRRFLKQGELFTFATVALDSLAHINPEDKGKLRDFHELYSPYLDCPATLVGAGGIGSTLLPLLVRCGLHKITIWDDDTVEPVNLAQQNFRFEDIGAYKAEVLANEAQAINPALEVITRRERFTQGDDIDGLVISGVDSMESRRTLFNEVCQRAEHVELFIDGRLSRSANEFVDLYFIDPKKKDEVMFYEEWLFTDEEAGPSGPRPTKLSAHTPILLAGLIGAGLARWIHDGRHPRKVTLDASTFTLEACWEA